MTGVSRSKLYLSFCRQCGRRCLNFKGLKVDLLYSTAYHPQSERTNQKAEIAFRYIIPALSNIHFWPQVLPVLQFALNSSSSGATKYSPHQLMYSMILGSA